MFSVVMNTEVSVAGPAAPCYNVLPKSLCSAVRMDAVCVIRSAGFCLSSIRLPCKTLMDFGLVFSSFHLKISAFDPAYKRLDLIGTGWTLLCLGQLFELVE